MRFTTALVAGSLAFVASAQQSSATVSIDPAQQSVVDCIDECDVTDIACLARCNPVPNPNEDQVEAAHNCIADCDQGDGTLAQTEAYARCQAACVKEHYYDSSMGTPEPTGGNGGGNGGNGGGNGGNGGSNDAETTAGAGETSAAVVTTGTATATVTDTTVMPSASESGSGSGSQTGSESPSGTETGDGASETGDGDNGASGIFASTAAMFGAAVAFFAL